MWPSRSQNHGRVWEAIFDNPKWILKVTSELGVNPILMGPGVRVYYENSYNQAQPPYMVLLACDPSGDTAFAYSDLLFESLRPHTFDKETLEVKFSDGSILNIHDAITCSEITRGEPCKIFDSAKKEPACWFVLWEDDRKRLRRIASKNIVSVDGVVKRMEQLSSICALYLSSSGRPRVVFQDHARKGLDLKPNIVDDRITGWQMPEKANAVTRWQAALGLGSDVGGTRRAESQFLHE